MIVLFKKKIVVDTSGREIRRVTTVLEQNNIKYEIRTKRTTGSVGRALDAGAYARSYIAMYKGADTPPVVYMVFVRRKDYDHAFELLY